MQFSLSDTLKPFIKSYSVITLDRDLSNEVFYPSGYVDLAINISDTIIDGHHRNMPHTEVLGQLTLPTRLTVAKGTSVILARIYPHASTLFFNNSISDFTNYAIDLNGVFANESREFYDRLMDTNSNEQKIKALDLFLTQKLISNEKVYRKTKIMEQLCRSICSASESFDIKKISNKHGLSERYVQRLFLDLVGLTPRSFFNIRRFNKSVQLVLSSHVSLTSIAYECGYHDQAHFTKEFRKYTGVTPSQAQPSLSLGVEFQQAVNIGL